jgi:hypothetical protein
LVHFSQATIVGSMPPKELARTPLKEPTTPMVKVLFELPEEPEEPAEPEDPQAAKQTAATTATIETAREDSLTGDFIFALR